MSNILKKVKLLLIEWHPLGEKTNQISDLENYKTETIDILFYIKKSLQQITLIK